MRKLMFVAVLCILGAGQVKADATCVSGSLTSYVNLVGGSCNYMGLDFSGFSTTSPNGITGSNNTGLTAAQITITPTNVGGIGLIISFTGNTDEAFPTGTQDINLPFEVKCVSGSSCLTNVFMSITGSATGTTAGGLIPGEDVLTESYCIGGSLPPTSPCPPPSGGATTVDRLTIAAGLGSTTVSQTDTFSTAVSQLAMVKDIGAYSGNQGFGSAGNGTGTITQVQDLFLVTTPEPSTILLLGMGLAGLALLSRRKLQASA